MDLKKRIDKILFQLFMNRTAKSVLLANIAGSIDFFVEQQEEGDESYFARTQGSKVFVGSNFENASDEDLKYAIFHEIWHIALMHEERRDDKDLEMWNKACDYAVANLLDSDGYKTTMDVLNSDSYRTMTEDQIYKILYDLAQQNPPPQGGGGDGEGEGQGQNQPDPNGGQGDSKDQPKDGSGGQLPDPNGKPQSGKGKFQPKDIAKEATPEERAKVQQLVEGAISQMSEKERGDLPGNLEQFIKVKDVEEKSWRTVLDEFLQYAVGDPEMDFLKPNKRFEEFHLPSWKDDSENIVSMNFYIDTSGSVSDESVQKYISEINYIKQVFKPEEIRISCFDTKIHSTVVYGEYEDIENFHVTGRGGTDFECIQHDIDETKPICAVVFTDLYADPMEQPKHKCGVLWIQYPDEDVWAGHQLKVGRMVKFK